MQSIFGPSSNRELDTFDRLCNSSVGTSHYTSNRVIKQHVVKQLANSMFPNLKRRRQKHCFRHRLYRGNSPSHLNSPRY